MDKEEEFVDIIIKNFKYNMTMAEVIIVLSHTCNIKRFYRSHHMTSFYSYESGMKLVNMHPLDRNKIKMIAKKRIELLH